MRDLIEGRDYNIDASGAVIMIRDLSISEFEDALDIWYKMPKMSDTMIVLLKYRYDHDREWTYENRILSPMPNFIGWEWDSDWNEGQQHVFVLGWIELQDVKFG